MAYISREDFIKLQQQKANRRAMPFDDSKYVTPFFSLKDGGETVVRFAYSEPEEVYKDIILVHQMQIDGKNRNVNCIRELNEPINKCPLCAAKMPVKQRLFIKLLEYTREEDGTIKVTPRLWDRPANGQSSYVNLLNNLFIEYGDISDMVFKIRRTGSKLDTTYSILPANPSVYNSQLYPKDFEAFKDYNIVGSWAVMDKSYDELAGMVGAPRPLELTTPVEDKPTVVPQEPAYTVSTTPRKVTW